LATALVQPAFADPNPNNSKKLREAVTVDGIYEHLEAFQQVADENNGNRAAGTSGYEASAQYVESQLEKAGYETERQYFTFTYSEVIAQSLTEISPTARDIENILMEYTPNTPAGGVTGELVEPEIATGCSPDPAAGIPESQWGDVDATGKIALVSRGGCTFASKTLAAAAAGAEAIIIYNNGEGTLNGTLGGPNDDFVPSTGITLAEGQALLAEMAAGPVVVNLEIEQLIEERETFNVFAETETGRDDNVVMVGAHLDHDAGPGINDNGSGSAAILETAIQLAEVNKLNNKVRFAWWGAEESGLLGSEHYVYDLVDNNPAELDNIATYLNFDMVGSPNYMIGVYDADESTYPAPADVPIPEGSAETEDVFTDYFDSIGQPWVDTQFSGRSDYQAFILNNIPASGLFTGAEGVKTAEQEALFGGTAGLAYDPNYHTPGDTIDNVSAEAIDINSDAIAHATITLAQSTEDVNGERSAGKSGLPKPGLSLGYGNKNAA
jgi:Zn-dependent M28 family amino/carboxypeptidase